MRLILALLALPMLVACGTGRDSTSTPVCDEQSVMAQSGRTDGRPISITCPR